MQAARTPREGLSYDEIAARLGYSPGWVRRISSDSKNMVCAVSD
ncbi:MAG TPA: hypothetical protein PKD09_19015 [Aggregatilinea sp.]|nr:helix-turn-helix domain-containing protein [Aggregatilinea sp.]HML23755.1 hypothetical protein [Aggregatilinea sp.]